MQPHGDGPRTPRHPTAPHTAGLAAFARRVVRLTAERILDDTPGFVAPVWLQRRLPVSAAPLVAWIAVDLALISVLGFGLVTLSRTAQLAANQRPARVLAVATAAPPLTGASAASPRPMVRVAGSGRAIAPGLELPTMSVASIVFVDDAATESLSRPATLPASATPPESPTQIPAQGASTPEPAALNLVALAQPAATAASPLDAATPLPTSTDVPTATQPPTDTPTSVATETIASTPTATETAPPTETASPAPTETPTRTPAPVVLGTWTPTLPGAPGWYGYGACALHEQTGPVGGNPLIWPADSHSVSGYVYSGWHPGIDVSALYGDPINAIDSGVVVYSGWNDTGYGTFLIIDHGDGLWSAYAHLSQTLVGCLDPVAQGQLIGLAGATGNAMGAHLHFEIYQSGIGQINPWPRLP